MSLISFSFIVFLPATVLVNFIFPRKQRYIWLFLASYFFYLSNDVRYAAGLIFCTITTYLTALIIERKKESRKKVFLAVCLVLNIAAILFFRHSTGTLGFVPIGISFYTLQAIGYLIDVYRGRITAERNPVRYAVFVSFFPTVLSGPIQRGTDLLPQLKEGRDFDYNKAHTGLYYLLWGYLLKLVMSNRLSMLVDFAYDRYDTMPGSVMLWATVLYAVQLYCDFAGYSALAIGTGRILGFDLCENFAQPYFAVSIKDFWNRWHISLSSWLRDYIYIPLGGNRRERTRKYLNLMITFIVSGLWHGQGVQFFVWGILHGVYQIAGDMLSGKSKKVKGFRQRIGSTIVTFVLADFAWIFFRSDSVKQAVSIVSSIIFRFDFKEMTYYGYYLLGGSRINLLLLMTGILIAFLIDFVHERNLSIERIIMSKFNTGIRWMLYIILTLFLLFMLVRFYGQSASTFIYERF